MPLRPLGRSWRRRAVVVLTLPLIAVSAGCNRTDTSDAPSASADSTHADTTRAGATHAGAARDRWVADIEALGRQVDVLDSAAVELAQAPTDSSAAMFAQRQFANARAAFKRVEFLAAYYEPSTTRAMNGPALPRVEDEEGPEAVFPPEGFQVIEELLFPEPDTTDRQAVVNEIRNLRAYVTRLRTSAAGQRVTDDRIWDAAKLQIARVVTLGVTGFDSPVALHSLAEAAESFRGMRGVLEVYRDSLGTDRWSALDGAFTQAIDVLASATSFDAFDRLHFIASGANPLARSLASARQQLAIGAPEERRAFRVAATTLFDVDAFDAHAFAAPAGARATPAQVTLGRALFFEPRVSGDGAMACASCHDPSRAFTDGRVRSVSRSGRASLRNSPTVINAGLQAGSFYDLRTTYLEDQVSDVVANAEEMHGSVDRAASALDGDSSYTRMFTAAFPAAGDSARSGRSIRLAIAAYIRSLQALNSRVDRALRGDTLAISAQEREGLNLFMGKAKCATCHFAPLFNGTVPPMYGESEVEVIGVPATNVVRNARIDPDSGRFRVTRSLPHVHAFKTPTVRNVELTAPYMHNGVYRTLEEVVDFYNRGGGIGIGAVRDNQTLPADTLGLTRRQQDALVQFMRALTDTVGVTGTPDTKSYRTRVARAVNAPRPR